MEKQIETTIQLSELQMCLIELEVFKISDFEVSLKTNEERFEECEIDTFEMISNC